jgi:hypothetical protein
MHGLHQVLSYLVPVEYCSQMLGKNALSFPVSTYVRMPYVEIRSFDSHKTYAILRVEGVGNVCDTRETEST